LSLLPFLFLPQRNTKKIHVFKLLFIRTSPPSFNRSTPLGLPHTGAPASEGVGAREKIGGRRKKRTKTFFFRENPKKSGKRSRSLSRQRDVAEEGRRRYFFICLKKTPFCCHILLDKDTPKIGSSILFIRLRPKKTITKLFYCTL
jgi:hypothetical protein